VHPASFKDDLGSKLPGSAGCMLTPKVAPPGGSVNAARGAWQRNVPCVKEEGRTLCSEERKELRQKTPMQRVRPLDELAPVAKGLARLKVCADPAVAVMEEAVTN
jgi:hypothetical protein